MKSSWSLSWDDVQFVGLGCKSLTWTPSVSMLGVHVVGENMKLWDRSNAHTIEHPALAADVKLASNQIIVNNILYTLLPKRKVRVSPAVGEDYIIALKKAPRDVKGLYHENAGNWK